jgi:hypothetical protein
MCRLVAIEPDLETHDTIVRVAPGHCTDMTGCIETVRTLDPDVVRITVISGDEPDTLYTREHGDWEAYRLRRHSA